MDLCYQSECLIYIHDSTLFSSVVFELSLKLASHSLRTSPSLVSNSITCWILLAMLRAPSS
jgi:hypothetical protein